MPDHVYFVAPENLSPTGGDNVMYQFAEILQEHGFSVSVHYSSSDFVYDFFESPVETTYSPPAPTHRSFGPRGLMASYRRMRVERAKSRRRGANRLAVPGPRDLVVLPEFWLRAQATRFPDTPQVALVQVISTALGSMFLPIARAEVGGRMLKGAIATSQACLAATETFSDLPVALVPLFLDGGSLSFHGEKARQIAYMPRKRPEESAVLVEFLRSDPALAGYEFVAIDRLKASEVHQILARSRIFLSFSEREGFGLPPAEAMAMGCITIGYTGVGGAEFFTPEVGVPVPDDDIAGFYRAVVDTVREYDADPSRLDAMRRRASDHILSTYTRQKSAKALLKAVAEIAR